MFQVNFGSGKEICLFLGIACIEHQRCVKGQEVNLILMRRPNWWEELQVGHHISWPPKFMRRVMYSDGVREVTAKKGFSGQRAQAFGETD